ncbi:ABC transporter ATP-binding protein [Ornithinimicrobium pekingense]|uniref:ABC transporter ATP-binding protein n=1 Tax=Ornithinimicrobium pekingense TaxID=384677 RepID=A0ABQ2FGB7_9MICO|nr:ABC transporter ATP-binding protein [Ornithinimicrobium pekingense]GGK83265.1 ABC transporter ATP-binding protein [Ornithinimicrobium pekingense]
MTALDASLAVRLDGFDLDVALRREHGVTAVLGPNGSGKTTALKALAGLHTLESGHVRVAGTTWADARTHLPPEARSVGMVLADPLLFPHLTLLDNVAFGPRSRGMPRAAARSRAAEELGRVGLAELTGRRPSQVSQGQAQRAALARALATDPALLLLDEPLSALDPQTRSVTRADLSHRLRDYAGVTVLVTHDPLDALTLADHLLFLEGGRVVQSGTPAEIVARPRSPYVAGVVGLNLVHGRLAGGGPPRLALAGGAELVVAEVPADARPGDELLATVNPAAVTLFTERPEASARNLWHLEVAAVTVTGQRARVRLHGVPGVELVAEVTLPAVAQLGVTVGTRLWAGVKATEVEVYPA